MGKRKVYVEQTVDCTYSKIKATTISTSVSSDRRLVKEPVATPYNRLLPVVLANWRLGGGEGTQVQSQPRLPRVISRQA